MSDSDSSDTTGFADQVVNTWTRPKLMFLLGLLFGSILVGTLAVSPPAALEPAAPKEIGAAALDHYQDRAPTGITYELVNVRSHDSGLYRVTLRVESGTHSTEETVYVTENGKWVFEQSPSQMQPRITG